jgi:predicted GH43/DUF377 family glycosyl hydrolase
MVRLERAKNNPILAPDKTNWWESKAVFNCSVLYDGKIVHMLYRAIGEYENYVSRVGYASSNDGVTFHRRKQVAMCPELDFERFGMEDPRLMYVENQVHVTYVVLSNYVRTRPFASSALATTDDFISYKRHGIITPIGSDDKDTVFLAGYDGGKSLQKYLVLHRPSKWVGPAYNTDRPSIWLGEGESVTKFRKHTPLIKPQENWDALKIGAGAPPIKTKKGWLVIYHGVSMERVYSAGAFLLDLNDPYKILGRTKNPILTPEEDYEKRGDVNNVVFPTGACVIGNQLLVYYGGADKVCCLATIDLNSLLEFLLSH